MWSPTSVQFLYKNKNGRYYVRTFAGGKEKWTGLRTTLLTVARNRMKEHLEAAEKQRVTGEAPTASGRLTFGEATVIYRKELAATEVRPNTKSYREAGVNLILRSWEGINELNVRHITSKMVEDWLRRFKANAKPHVPKGAKTASRNSTGASVTTLKCAHDAVRQVLDAAISTGYLYANPARNPTVTDVAKRMFKASRRERAERGSLTLPTREEFFELIEAIRTAGVAECKAAAIYVQFIAYSGARKNEAAHVLWSDVDFRRGTIHLRVTKNGEARFIPMTEEMRQLLQRLDSERSDQEQSTTKDRVLLIKEAQGFIDSACRKLGVKRFTAHALRHLFGTACLEAGVDVRTVAGWLGHKDNGALLLKVYSHVRGQHEVEMIRKVRFAPLDTPAPSDHFLTNAPSRLAAEKVRKATAPKRLKPAESWAASLDAERSKSSAKRSRGGAREP